MTRGSWQAALTALERTVKESERTAAGKMLAEDLEELRAEPRWEAISDELAPGIEVAYQRYVHQKQ